MGFGLQCIQCAAGMRRRKQSFRREGCEATAKPPARARAASVCSVAKTAGTEGGIPQNTQNGLTPDTEHTENFQKAWGSDFSVFSVPPEAASVCSVAKNGWHGGRVLPQNTQNGLRPTPNTQNVLGKGGAAFSVFSGRKRSSVK